MQDSGELGEHRDGRPAWADVERGQFVKHKNHFLKSRNRRRRAVERTLGWLFEGEMTFPHMASDLSLCIFLLSHRASITTPGFSVLFLSVGVAHRGVSLPAGRCAGRKRGRFLWFCTLPLQPPTYLLYNTVLTSLSGLPTVRWRSRRGLRLGEHEMEQRGGVRDERSPLRQWNRSHFTFCHETKVPSDYKPNCEPGC